MLTSIHASLRVRRQLARELQMEQTRWLANAGLARGWMRASNEAGYTGESWTVSPALSENTVANVVITLTTTDVPDGQVGLQVVATLCGTEANSKPTRKTESMVISLNQTKKVEVINDES
jgi:hypothetical protein